jgi:hypothetical protein
MKPLFTTEQIADIADILKLGQIGNIHRSPVLYRGQNDDWPLVPKIARPWDEKKNEIGKVLAREKWLLAEFRRQGVAVDSVPKEERDILSLAQHHGLCTRLLDWTQNVVAAIWFAVEGHKEGQQPVVWCFETVAEDFDDEASCIDAPRTIVFRPNHVTVRIRVQSGWFTVHRLKEGKTYPLETIPRYGRRLTKGLVDGDVGKLRKQLNEMGVNRASLFPDLGNLCKHLNWESRGVTEALSTPEKSGFVRGGSTGRRSSKCGGATLSPAQHGNQ